jgi:response regulator of citrate/malate metabolism
MRKNSDSKKIKHGFVESRFLKNIKENLTVVETKRIKDIKSILEGHKKLTSSELTQWIGLSRTRCNEYFKIMEKLNIVEPVIIRREKCYRLKK